MAGYVQSYGTWLVMYSHTDVRTNTHTDQSKQGLKHKQTQANAGIGTSGQERMQTAQDKPRHTF